MGGWKSYDFQTLGWGPRRLLQWLLQCNAEPPLKAFFVHPRLAFGSKVNKRRHVVQLRALGITHVVDLRGYHSRKLRRFKKIWLGFRDDGKPRPRWFYGKALKFYQKAMSQPKTRLFLMCRVGKRRSASLAYFLLRASGMSARRAEALVRRARPCAMIVQAYRESCEEYLRRRERWYSPGTGGDRFSQGEMRTPRPSAWHCYPQGFWKSE